MDFRDDELEFSFFRSRGPGGQKKNVTDSAVRLRHIPTGIVVVATASRSQHRNKQAAIEELKRRIERRNRRTPPRIKTRPSLAARRRRVEEKKQRARTKERRRPPGEE